MEALILKLKIVFSFFDVVSVTGDVNYSNTKSKQKTLQKSNFEAPFCFCSGTSFSLLMLSLFIFFFFCHNWGTEP